MHTVAVDTGEQVSVPCWLAVYGKCTGLTAGSYNRSAFGFFEENFYADFHSGWAGFCLHHGRRRVHFCPPPYRHLLLAFLWLHSD